MREESSVLARRSMSTADVVEEVWLSYNWVGTRMPQVWSRLDDGLKGNDTVRVICGNHGSCNPYLTPKSGTQRS